MKSTQKEKIKVLSIPNYYSSFYLYALDLYFDLEYTYDPRFEKFNNRAFLVFSFQEKYAVICNNDPSGPKPDLYEMVDFYFMTNKLIDHPNFQKDKLIPLFPHFPVNALGAYFRIYGFELLRKIPLTKLCKEVYTQNKRPKYNLKNWEYSFDNYVFFAANLWKKEPQTNQLRAEFIRICKKDPRIDFEGGFVARQDGDTMGYEQEINQTIFSPKTFSKKSAKTAFALNNPAVLGAISWRFAEYLMDGVMVMSYPFAIELPKLPVDREEIHFVNNSFELQEAIDLLFANPDYHKKLANGSRAYFERNCTPEAQTAYILSVMVGN